MPVKITITCDMPEGSRSTDPDKPEIRCYSSVNENIVGLYEGATLNDLGQAILTLRKQARFQGWGRYQFMGASRFLCPGCVARFKR